MKTTIFIYFLLLVAIISCNNKKSNSDYNKNIAAIEVDSLQAKGLELLKTRCYACHSVTTKSHDEIIAPPMAAVKRRYMRSYTTEDEFVNAIKNWVNNPTSENALMKGAVDKFKTMP